MTEIVGAQLDQLLDLRLIFVDSSESIDTIIASIRSKFASTAWTGPAAERFRNSWVDEYELVLRNVQTVFNDAAFEVQQRHDAINEATS